jgi:hypothetical protein
MRENFEHWDPGIKAFRYGAKNLDLADSVQLFIWNSIFSEK